MILFEVLTLFWDHARVNPASPKLFTVLLTHFMAWAKLWVCLSFFSYGFLSLSYDLRNSCSICSICHWSHESFHNFVRSQDDFASFANTEGGNYPSRIRDELRLLLNHLDGLTRCKQNCRELIMPAAAAAGTRWWQQYQQQLCNYKMIATWCCCCNMMLLLQHVANLPQLGNNCKQTFLMSFICFFLLSFYFFFFYPSLKRKICSER